MRPPTVRLTKGGTTPEAFCPEAVTLLLSGVRFR